MSGAADETDLLPAEVLAHYADGYEAQRLQPEGRVGRIELLRTLELVARYLPPAPAVVLDIGGGPGVYACWLARQGYEVHLVDALPLHVELARRASAAQPDAPIASVTLGDARRLEFPDASADAVLLFGPLYHLTERSDRIAALAEARRVLRPGGLALAVGISRFASMMDGMFRGLLADPVGAAIIQHDLTDGQHRNPTNIPTYFTTAYFHYPTELQAEVEAAGLRHEATLAIEGPAWAAEQVAERWDNAAYRERVLEVVRRIEAEPVLLGASAHLMAVARTPTVE
jgi:SAM-dependent methyltransferase